jgi:hypothetical protein
MHFHKKKLACAFMFSGNFKETTKFITKHPENESGKKENITNKGTAT